MKATLRLLIGAAAAVLGAIAPPAFAADPAAPPPQPLLAIDQKLPDSIELGAAVPHRDRGPQQRRRPAEGVTVTDQLPAGYELLAGAPTPERTADGLIWRVGRLAPGEQATLRLRLGPKAGEPAAPTRNAVDATFQVRASSARTVQVARPELALNVTGPDAAVIGQSITFRIVVSNNGTVAARDVTLHALMGEGLTCAKGTDLEAGVGALAPGESRSRQPAGDPDAARRTAPLVRRAGPGRGASPARGGLPRRGRPSERDGRRPDGPAPGVHRPVRPDRGQRRLGPGASGRADRDAAGRPRLRPRHRQRRLRRGDAHHPLGPRRRAAGRAARGGLERDGQGGRRPEGDDPIGGRRRRGGRPPGRRRSWRKGRPGRRPASSPKPPGSDPCRARHRGRDGSRKPYRGSWRRAVCSY